LKIDKWGIFVPKKGKIYKIILKILKVNRMQQHGGAKKC